VIEALCANPWRWALRYESEAVCPLYPRATEGAKKADRLHRRRVRERNDRCPASAHGCAEFVPFVEKTPPFETTCLSTASGATGYKSRVVSMGITRELILHLDSGIERRIRAAPPAGVPSEYPARDRRDDWAGVAPQHVARAGLLDHTPWPAPPPPGDALLLHRPTGDLDRAHSPDWWYQVQLHLLRDRCRLGFARFPRRLLPERETSSP